MCGGVPGGPACTDDPRLEARSSIDAGGGYHDVPCPDGQPPETYGTPLPPYEGAAVKAARPLSIDRLEIPTDHVGSYEVSLGEASLPNGVATSASFAFVDTWPLDLSLDGGAA